ncbi:MAG: T9SS type A sorting domain-containing protein [Sphingobacteriaceae bacterium]|nr:MAG: T9SS type A sorting domain-containing protein [Sphingobacteriaceae bacterium]
MSGIKFILVKISVFVSGLFFVGTALATDYYVSNSAGNDSYNGLAGTYGGTNGPWKTLTKVNAQTFAAGDRIFLKTGDAWVSQSLQLHGLGTSTNPITLSSYGTGAKPRISPQITDAYGITLYNTAGWKIIGIEIEKARAGIALQYNNTYNNDYVYIDNISIHDIDDTYNSAPNLYNHFSAGILLEGNGNTSAYHLTNLTVKNITFSNVNCSWWVGCIAAYTNSSGFGTNARFRYVTVNNLSAVNGKQWGYSFNFLDDATITNADCNNTGFGTNIYGSAGIVVAYANRVVLDSCDVYNSRRGPQAYDGCGFDFEGGLSTSYITYKNAVIDHTDGCGVFVFNNNGVGGTPNLLLENVSISNFGENIGNSSAGIDFSSPGNSSGIVRNCVINRSIATNAFFTGYPTVPANFTFTNNTYKDINIASVATVTASTTDTGNGYSPAKAVDGNTADFSGWSSLTGSPQWLELAWASYQNIQKVELFTTSGYYLKDYDIQYWDGSDWQTVAAIRNNVQKKVTSTFANISTTKLRIYCITPDPTLYSRIDEVRVYNDGLGNGGFEQPSTSTYQYGPLTHGWTFDAGSGVQKNGGGFGANTAPDGVQTAFIQSTGVIKQDVGFSAAGNYYLKFKASKRTCCGGTQSFNVYVDATLVGSYTPSSATFTDFTTSSFLVVKGNHTIKFVGTVSGDNTDFIDKVELLPYTGSGLMAASQINKAETEEKDSKDDFSFYPNPAYNDVNVGFTIKQQSALTLRVFKLGGKMVLQQNLNNLAPGNHITKLNTSNLEAGIYIIKLTGNNFEKSGLMQINKL